MLSTSRSWLRTPLLRTHRNLLGHLCTYLHGLIQHVVVSGYCDPIVVGRTFLAKINSIPTDRPARHCHAVDIGAGCWLFMVGRPKWAVIPYVAVWGRICHATRRFVDQSGRRLGSSQVPAVRFDTVTRLYNTVYCRKSPIFQPIAHGFLSAFKLPRARNSDSFYLLY